MNSNKLILVDDNDAPTGVIDKMEAHVKGLLHRAFSIFIFNTKGELLLQQRAEDKYHSGGLWTNTCCSHPIYNEDIETTLFRRLQEEMGIKCNTEYMFKFKYKVKFDNGLTEHEYDHVYFGINNDPPILNPYEVKAWKYMSHQDITEDIKIHPEKYTEWLKIIFPRIQSESKNYFEKHNIF